MLLYGVIIFISTALVAAANMTIPTSEPLSVIYIVLAVILNTAAVIALDAIGAFLIRRLPERLFTGSRGIFAVSRREAAFYCHFGVRKWKDIIPELGVFTHFPKNRVYEPDNNEYVGRFLLESNYGVVIHAVNAVFGFLIIFIYPLQYAPRFGLPLAFVNFVLSVMPVMALRYNTPKLVSLYKLNERRSKRNNLKAQDAVDSK